MRQCVCTVCGSVFEAVDYRTKYCLAHKSYRQRELQKTETGANNRNWRGGRMAPIERTCLICPTVFTTNLVHDKKLCGLRCAAIWGRMHSKKKNTNIEQIVQTWLEQRGLPFQSQVRISNIGIVDFLVGTSVIQCDGVYWHTLPWRSLRDVEQDAALNALGYAVVRISDAEIKKEPIGKIIQRKAWIATSRSKWRVSWQ